MARFVALATFVTLALMPMAAVAQDYPRLHVTALGMHADVRSVAVGVPFRVTIHVHVNENRDRLDELVLPTLANAVDLGDERRRVATPGGGTDFYEIMTVAASAPGAATFSPAYIDAIDPSNGRAFRYSSQPLSVRVTAGAPIDAVTHSVSGLLTRGLLVLGGVVAAFVGVFVLVWVLLAVRARANRRPATAPPPPQPAPAAGPVGDPVRNAVAAFRARPDDGTLDALRNALFVRAGAAPGATLADALRALGSANPDLARVMAVAERARFGPASGRGTATRDLLALLDGYLATEAMR